MPWLNAVKGLTLTNVLVIALLAVVAVPVYWVYQIMNDEAMYDRFFSYYRELSSQNVGCTLREIRYKGTHSWAISTGLAFQGADRYLISVVVDHDPNDEFQSFCEALKLMADELNEGNT